MCRMYLYFNIFLIYLVCTTPSLNQKIGNVHARYRVKVTFMFMHLVMPWAFYFRSKRLIVPRAFYFRRTHLVVPQAFYFRSTRLLVPQAFYFRSTHLVVHRAFYFWSTWGSSIRVRVRVWFSFRFHNINPSGLLLVTIRKQESRVTGSNS